MMKPGFFGWFQIVCLAIFTVSITARTLNLLIRQKINPIVLSPGKKGWLGFMEISLFVGVNAWCVAVLLYALGYHAALDLWILGAQLVDSMVAKVAGAVLIVIAFGLFFLSLIALGNSWRLGIDERKPGELVTWGVYAVSRNPIYVFFDLYFIGTFLINGALLFLVFAALAAANLHYQILQEEEFLARVHGPAYASYRARTGRYFSWQLILRQIGLWVKPRKRTTSG